MRTKTTIDRSRFSRTEQLFGHRENKLEMLFIKVCVTFQMVDRLIKFEKKDFISDYVYEVI